MKAGDVGTPPDLRYHSGKATDVYLLYNSSSKNTSERTTVVKGLVYLQDAAVMEKCHLGGSPGSTW